MTNLQRMERLKDERDLPDEELLRLLEELTDPDDPRREQEQETLSAMARQVRETVYGNDVYVRGLIEFSNICKNDCYYCGIRRSNEKAERYRLTAGQIMDCAKEGYALGFRTFVLQSGEDGWFTKERMADVIRAVKTEFPDCAVTLSAGERDREDYQCWKDAGADRYLLRHETASDKHYAMLHPADMSLRRRKECLYALRELGYQVGAGMMVGSPGQTYACLLADIRFLQDLRPHMIGIGPFLAHRDTPFAGEADGSCELTLVLLSVLRLMFPEALLPATTALSTVSPDGRERGLRAGANVLMPNLTPAGVREKYRLYDNKACTGEESAQGIARLAETVRAAGCRIVTDRGDSRVEVEKGAIPNADRV